MNSKHEIIEYNKDLPVKLFCQRIGSVGKHWHRSIEILLVLSGNMDVLVENEHYILNENDLLLINSNQVHETYSDDCVLIALQLRLSKFHMEWLAAEAPFFLCNSALQGDNKNFDTLRSLIAKLIQQNTDTSSYTRLLCYSLACQLIYELLAHFRTEPPAFPRTRKQMERLGDIIRYIEENYASEITLKDLAAREFLSSSYLSHFFEKNMNISFLNYVTKIRIEHSISYLLYSNKSIEEIAQACGFSNPRSYASFFQREYKMLPSRFRKEKKETALLPSPVNTGEESSYLTLEKYDVFSKLNTYLKNPKEALTIETVRVSLGTIPIQSSKPFLNNALTFCTVGRAKEILYKNIQDMLTIQQKEIGFTYIKFHGIFDDALMVYREDSTGNPIFNFNMLDEILDFLLSIRLRPLIQFSFMPKALAKTPEATFFTVPFIMSEPKDNTKWELLVTRFTEHVLSRYGLQEVSQWIFTFWNETLTGFPFDFKTEDTAFYLYEITANAVRLVNPQLKFANTSFINRGISKAKINRFFEYVKEHNCEPDAYLFHFYPTLSESYSTLSDMNNCDKFMDFMSKNRTVLNSDSEAFGKYLDELNLSLLDRREVPLYITEWNLSPSHRELLNDTCFAGAYFIRNILMNYNKAQGFGHWTLTDWIEELPFPGELFHGGVGHFTKNGIKKPAYYAYLFLSKLKDEVISQGEGYFITKEKNKDTYSILLYHYCHFSEIYGKGFNFNFSVTDRYQIFNGAVNKELSFSLSGMADGEYRITEHIVNRRYGSCFDKWVEMGAAPLITTEETDALRQLSHPLLKIKTYTVINQQLDYEDILEPHEIRLIQLSKKS